MKGSGSIFAAIFGLWVAGILQIALAPRLALGLGSPDFCLVLLGSLGLFYDRRGTTLLGFGAGWICGSLAGVNLTIYIASRCLVGFLLGWLLSFGIQRNYLVAAISGAGISMLAQLILLFLGAYRGAIVPYLAGTLVTSMYDGVIAAMLFLMIDRLANPRRQDRF